VNQIAFITDAHLDEQFPMDYGVNARINFETVLQDIRQKGINEIVFGGDIGEASAHPYFFKQLQGFSCNIILGNHDRFSEVGQYFHKSISPKFLFYQFTNNDYQYIFLDTSTENICGEQIELLISNIDKTKHIILFVHHPIIRIDTIVDSKFPLQNREKVQLLLSMHPKPVHIFCGHYHLDDYQCVANISQTCTPAISFQIDKNADAISIQNKHFAYRLIRIKEHSVTSELIQFLQKK
jgi:3',5'-cyclic-AMP phosphodiesterase